MHRIKCSSSLDPEVKKFFHGQKTRSESEPDARCCKKAAITRDDGTNTKQGLNGNDYVSPAKVAVEGAGR